MKDLEKINTQSTVFKEQEDIDLPSLAEKPRPSGRGWIGRKSEI